MSSAIGPPRQNPIQAFCALPCVIIAIALILIFAVGDVVASALGGSVGSLLFIGLAIYCCYRCHKNKQNKGQCTPC